ncbi:hypothetical protein [Micromonospora gifhornensis]
MIARRLSTPVAARYVMFAVPRSVYRVRNIRAIKSDTRARVHR